MTDSTQHLLDTGALPVFFGYDIILRYEITRPNCWSLSWVPKPISGNMSGRFS